MHAEIPCTELISPQNTRTQEHKNQWQNNTLVEGCSSKSLCTESAHIVHMHPIVMAEQRVVAANKQQNLKKKRNRNDGGLMQYFFRLCYCFPFHVLKLLYIFHSYMVWKIDDQSFLFIPFLIRFLLWFSRNISASIVVRLHLFFFFYFLKHNISSEENGDTTHRDRVIPNIIYSLQYYRADCEFWWCGCIFIVLLNPAKLDQILRNHIPAERSNHCLAFARSSAWQWEWFNE